MTSSTDAGWWERPWVLAAFVLLTAGPMLWPATPPLIDLPGHLARYQVAAEIHSSPYLARYFAIEWTLIPNLGVDLLVFALAPILGVELAAKAVVIAIPVCTAAGFLWVAREVHGRIPPTALFAFPLAYNYPFLYGFVNYSLAAALALLGFGLWLRLGRLGRLRLRALLFLFIAPVIWVAHIYGWGILGVLAFGSEAVRRRNTGQGWIAGLGSAAIQCVPLALPILVMGNWRGQGGGSSEGWLDWSLKIKWLLGILRDRWMAFDILSAAIIYGILAAALFARRWVRINWTLGVPALMLWLTFAILPTTLMGSYFASVRIIPYAAAMSLLALGPRREIARRYHNGVAVAATLFFALRLAGSTASGILYDRSYRDELTALDHVQPDSRIVALVGQPCGNQWFNPRLTNLPNMATVRRHAYVNGQFDGVGAQTLRITYPQAGNFRSNGSQKTSVAPCTGPDRPFAQALGDIPRTAFDYLWVMNVAPGLWPRQPEFQLLWQRGDSALYRIVPLDAKTR